MNVEQGETWEQKMEWARQRMKVNVDTTVEACLMANISDPGDIYMRAFMAIVIGSKTPSVNGEVQMLFSYCLAQAVIAELEKRTVIKE